MFNQVFVNTEKLYRSTDNRLLSGKMEMETTRKGATYQSCTLSCFAKTTKICRGLLFSNTEPLPMKCIHIIDDTGTTDLTPSAWDGYQVYYLARKNPMTQWIWPQPKLYFPLDDDTGTRLSSNPENIAFIGGGIVGNAFYNPISGGRQSYYRLGHYDPPDYCFPVPPSCPLGMTVAFWAKFLNDTGTIQGIMTTKTPTGQGFKINWQPNHGLKFVTQRDYDNMEEVLKIGYEIFLDNYGYGKWVHYIFQYHFNATNPGNNMNIYLNGEARPDSEKYVQAWSGTPGQDGDFELGHVHVGQNSKYGNIMVDEIFIWEEMLTHEQIVRLYQAYDNY